ncbi:hypothetical protein LJB82_02835 [Desulfovibrio sp. OttesenSCG-928-M16]|nr:hypothetical protein [Desulfovibrio sp. OttesenSCG-928-M16]
MANPPTGNRQRHTTLACLLLFALILSLSSPAMVLGAEKTKLPAGVVALSESVMPWDDAKAFCAERGGKLPLIAGLSKWNGEKPPKANVPIAGFGKEGLPWNTVGLPSGSYWTGTLDADDPNISWYFYEDGGNGKVSLDIVFNDASSGETNRVVCVP